MKLAHIQADKWHLFSKSMLESSPLIISAHHLNFLQLLPWKSPKKLSALTMEANASSLSTLVLIEHASYPHRAPHTCKFGIPALDIYLFLPGNRIYMQLLSLFKSQNLSCLSNPDNDQDLFTNKDKPLEIPNFYIYTYIRKIMMLLECT